MVLTQVHTLTQRCKFGQPKLDIERQPGDGIMHVMKIMKENTTLRLSRFGRKFECLFYTLSVATTAGIGYDFQRAKVHERKVFLGCRVVNQKSWMIILVIAVKLCFELSVVTWTWANPDQINCTRELEENTCTPLVLKQWRCASNGYQFPWRRMRPVKFCQGLIILDHIFSLYRGASANKTPVGSRFETFRVFYMSEKRCIPSYSRVLTTLNLPVMLLRKCGAK